MCTEIDDVITLCAQTHFLSCDFRSCDFLSHDSSHVTFGHMTFGHVISGHMTSGHVTFDHVTSGHMTFGGNQTGNQFATCRGMSSMSYFIPGNRKESVKILLLGIHCSSDNEKF